MPTSPSVTVSTVTTTTASSTTTTYSKIIVTDHGIETVYIPTTDVTATGSGRDKILTFTGHKTTGDMSIGSVEIHVDDKDIVYVP